jgi:hypothetical protein
LPENYIGRARALHGTGALEFTRMRIPALFQHTWHPWELIVVHNGSSERMADFLTGVGASSNPVLLTNRKTKD